MNEKKGMGGDIKVDRDGAEIWVKGLVEGVELLGMGIGGVGMELLEDGENGGLEEFVLV